MDKINFQNGVTKVNADTFTTFQNNIDEAKAEKSEQIKTVTYQEKFSNVSTATNIDFLTMFPNLTLSQVICFNIEITDVYDTWDRVFANILTTGQLQVRSYNQTQEVTVRVTAFYK